MAETSAPTSAAETVSVCSSGREPVTVLSPSPQPAAVSASAACAAVMPPTSVPFTLTLGYMVSEPDT